MVGITDRNSAANARQIRITPNRSHYGEVWKKLPQMIRNAMPWTRKSAITMHLVWMKTRSIPRELLPSNRN
jgi:hypothetical protein